MAEEDVNDKLMNFFRQRKQYSKSKKTFCINCLRDVGTEFTTEFWHSKRVFRIKCGDKEEPCDLNTEIIIKKDLNNYETLQGLKDDLRTTSIDIFKLKNMLTFEVINKTLYDNEFEKLENKYNLILKKINVVDNAITKRDERYNILKQELQKHIDNNQKIDDVDLKIRNYFDENFLQTKNKVFEYYNLIKEPTTKQNEANIYNLQIKF